MTASRPPAPAAAIFDLDGVLTDTAELHYRSWASLAIELAIPFNRSINDRMRGLSRPESLQIFLADHAHRFPPTEQQRLLDEKNRRYLAQVANLTHEDLLPGARQLLEDLRSRGISTAVASSSRNANVVVDQLGIRPLLDTLIDANQAPRSKPDPQVFRAAAAAVAVPPARCVVLEDAEAGVAAAQAAGMRVVGLGPIERVGRADLVIESLTELSANRLIELLSSE